MTDNKNRYCLFFDWDGTLRVGRDVSPENIAALNAVQEKGHFVVLNTGRGPKNIPDYAMNLVKWDGLVAGMSYAEFAGEVVMEDYLPKSALKHLCRFLEKTDTPTCVQGNGNVYMLRTENDDRSISMEDFEKLVDEDYDALKVTNIALNGDIRTMPLNEFSGCWSIYHEEGCYSEIMLNGHDKSTGIKKITEKLGIPREHTVSFGDSINDLDMLKYTGISVVMKSAVPALDGVATYRTADDRTGVAEAINKIFFEGTL